jgi:subtilisin family serine protease
MAAPIVAGAIALMRAENPALDPVEIERRLIRAVDLLPQLKSKVRTGGRLNLAKLLREATEPLKKGRAKRSVTLRKEITKQSLGGIRIEGGTKRTLRPAGQKIPKSGNISGIKIQ